MSPGLARAIPAAPLITLAAVISTGPGTVAKYLSKTYLILSAESTAARLAKIPMAPHLRKVLSLLSSSLNNSIPGYRISGFFR